MEAKDSQRFKFSGGGNKCIYCLSKTGWSFIRNYGIEYGQCFSCGIKNYPQNTIYSSPKPQTIIIEKPISVNFISEEVVKKSLKCYKYNPFVLFLESVFKRKATQKVLDQFRIGTAKNEGTVFWYIDKKMLVRKPKVVYYKSNGKRIKEKQPHCGGFTNQNGFELCLFGEHQLNEFYYPLNTPVFVVESEKTACIGFLVMPQYIWIAIGGDKLNQERAVALVGRNVIILPDADEPGRNGAKGTSQILTRLNVSHKVVDLFPEKNDKTDLADYIIFLNQLDQTKIIIRHIPTITPFLPEKSEKLEEIFQKNPVMWELTERLGLIVKDVK